MGILGGLGRKISAPDKSGLSIADRLAIFATAANGDFESALSIRNAPVKRAELERMKMLSAQAAGVLQPVRGEMREIPGQMRDFGVVDDDGGDISAAFGMEQGPSRMVQGPSRQRSPQETAAELAKYAGMGVDIKDLLKAAEYAKLDTKVGPDGLGYDPADASNVGRAFPTAPAGGWNDQSSGRPVTRMAQGYNEAVMGTKAAETMGVEATKSAYDLIDIPDGNGGTIKMPRSAYLGMIGGGKAGQQGGMGYTPPAAQLAGDKIVAEAGAGRLNDLRGAVAADAKITPILDQMESLLKGGNLITGFAADAQLATHRALAAAGNKESARKVADTQTYQNLTSRQVLPLVKALGSAQSITDADRKFTQAIVAGDIALDEETIRRVIEIGREQIRANATALQQMQGSGGGYQSGRTGPASGPRTSMGRSRITAVEQ